MKTMTAAFLAAVLICAFAGTAFAENAIPGTKDGRPESYRAEFARHIQDAPPADVPNVETLMQVTGDEAVQMAAMKALALKGAEARGATPILLVALIKNTNPVCRAEAAKTIGVLWANDDPWVYAVPNQPRTPIQYVAYNLYKRVRSQVMERDPVVRAAVTDALIQITHWPHDGEKFVPPSQVGRQQ